MKSWRTLIWGILLAAFFVSTAFALKLPGETVFVSPDENAAFTFSQLLAKEGTLRFHEPLNTELFGRVHPRSTVPFADVILPGSFLGFVFATAIVGAVLGATGTLLVTPVIAVLAVLAWRKTVTVMTKSDLVGDLAGFFLLVHPAFWYYSGRVMMHNVAFTAALLFAAWFAVAQPFAKQRLFNFALAGLSVGAALFIRTAEAPWVIVGAFTLLVLYRHVIGWRAMTVFLAALALTFVAQLGVNDMLYGSPFTTGYTAQYDFGSPVLVQEEVPSASQTSGGTIDVTKPWTLLLPFGFHERVILRNVWGYGFLLYPVFSSLAAIGIVFALVKNKNQRKSWKALAIGTLVLAAWLGALYGSWKIFDNPDPRAVTLGNSHVRYWLPLFALASVFAARAIAELLAWRPFTLERSWGVMTRQIVAGAVLIAAFVSALVPVYFSEDGFLHSREALASVVEKRDRILALTEDSSIIVVDRADKYLFPERRVIVPLRDDRTYAVLPAAVELAPVYYFGITFPESDIAYLNQVKLPPLGLRIELVETVQEESLYRIVKQ